MTFSDRVKFALNGGQTAKKSSQRPVKGRNSYRSTGVNRDGVEVGADGTGC